MANYTYDEGGNMALYFLLTFLALILVPLTLSISPKKRHDLPSCECEPCTRQQAVIKGRERGSLLRPKITKKTVFLIVGWTLFVAISYKASGMKIENKVYDPFEVLGIRSGSTEKEIKSHFKKLSKKFHPDKVKATANETIEMIQNRFVEFTKAYKSLTDETIRKNWELYGHPDGRQEMTMGIALPKWIVEGKNNIWVLGLYGILFGVSLPILVGRWWFGSQRKSKDGIHLQSAAAFFRTLREDSTMDEVVGCLGKAFQWEQASKRKRAEVDVALDGLEKQINDRLGHKWETLCDLVATAGTQGAGKRRALVLLYAYLLRIPIDRGDLRQEQLEVLTKIPTLLNALLAIAVSRNWLIPTVSIMRLHAYVTQALLPANGPGTSRLRFAQLPGVNPTEVQLGGELAPEARDFDEFIDILEKNNDPRVNDMKKVVNTWGRLDVVDVSFKVIEERIVTPSSIVYLVAKLRIVPPTTHRPDVEPVFEEKKASSKETEFLMSRQDAEELDHLEDAGGSAHTPFWPSMHKPGWWMLITDEKNNRVVVPPMKITDVPYYSRISQHGKEYRSYKLQFQAPPNTGYLSWKIHFISDTFVGEEVKKNIVLKVEDFSALTAEEQGSEDEISDPDEDTLAGQMAAMRGGKVKKRAASDDSDDESSTDEDEDDESSSSDSD